MRSQLTGSGYGTAVGGKRKAVLGRGNPCAVAQRQTKQQTVSKQNGVFSCGKRHNVPNVWRIDFEEGSCKELSKTFLIVDPVLWTLEKILRRCK